MGEVYPPFTERHSFTGPTTAISCEVVWSDEHEHYEASSSVGFRGTGRTADAAALACFTAWVTGTGGWFEPPSV